jgi:hypothetical protein
MRYDTIFSAFSCIFALRGISDMYIKVIYLYYVVIAMRLNSVCMVAGCLRRYGVYFLELLKE